MAETDDDDQKTEEPSDKRIEEARDEGQLPISREMATWVLFVAGVIVLAWLGPLMGRDMGNALKVFLEKPHEMSLEGGGFQQMAANIVSRMALSGVLVFMLLFAASILGTALQTGFYADVQHIKADLTRLSPLVGLKQLFSSNAIADLIKSFVKLVVLGYVAIVAFKKMMVVLPLYCGMDLVSSIAFMHHEALHVVILLMLVITVIAVADIVYMRHRYFKGLRMTKQEIKDEHKQMEGDPLIKGRLRQMRLERARRRMMAKVPKADVIVTNPTHYAVALKYDNAKMNAPVLLAKGVDVVAERIRELATKNNIPLVSNPPLARALYDTVDMDEVIKPEHYRAVAEVISYVYKLKKKAGPRTPGPLRKPKPPGPAKT